MTQVFMANVSWKWKMNVLWKLSSKWNPCVRDYHIVAVTETFLWNVWWKYLSSSLQMRVFHSQIVVFYILLYNFHYLEYWQKIKRNWQTKYRGSSVVLAVSSICRQWRLPVSVVISVTEETLALSDGNTIHHTIHGGRKDKPRSFN